MAGRPEVPSGLRRDQVPEASMTAATVWSRVSPPVFDPDGEGCGVAVAGVGLVHAVPGHGDDPGAGCSREAISGSAASGAR